MLLKEWATLERDFEGTPNGGHPDAELIPASTFRTYGTRTVLGKRTKEVRKALSHDDCTSRQQAMHMPPLRHSFARLGNSDQSSEIDTGDLCEMIGEHTSS